MSTRLKFTKFINQIFLDRIAYLFIATKHKPGRAAPSIETKPPLSPPVSALIGLDRFQDPVARARHSYSRAYPRNCESYHHRWSFTGQIYISVREFANFERRIEDNKRSKGFEFPRF